MNPPECLAPPTSFVTNVTTWIGGQAKAPLHALARRAARSYISGATVSDALSVSEGLWAKGICTALGYWDAVGTAPETVFAAYCDALDALATAGRDSYLSIKLPALGYSHELLEKLAIRAKEHAIRLHFDAMAPETVDQTWQAIELVSQHGIDLGCTLPARWRRSPDDAEWAARHGLAVRVVKGQWEDPSAPDHDPRSGFAAVIDRLAGRARAVAVATHDLATGRSALERLGKAGTPATLELLYGLPMVRQLDLAREFTVPVRVYVPYGEAYLPYCLSQLKRRPWLAWWLVRDAVCERLKGSRAL
jgi:proline dehydrogenase